MKTSIKTSGRILFFACLILMTVAAVSIADAQTNSVDTSFNAVPDKNLTEPAKFLLQPDNKIIVFGNLQSVNGTISNRVVRFNTDGSFDTTFNCTICDFTITTAVLQPDGKIIVAGSSPGIIYRLNPDGSRDTSFTAFSNVGRAFVHTVLPDGKFLAIFHQTYRAGAFDLENYYLYRLNANGTVDNTFNINTFISGGSAGAGGFYPTKLSVQPDGKIIIAGNHNVSTSPSGSLRRFNANGTTDTTFEAPNLTNSGSSPGTLINDLEIQADGSLLLAGRFTAINAISRSNVARLQSAGNVDMSFGSAGIGETTKIKFLSSGKILVSTSSQFYRLNADGSLDNSFSSPPTLTQINDWAIDSAGKIFVYGTFFENGASVDKFARLGQDGSIESSFTATIGIAGLVTAIAVQSDGKVIFAGGDFIRVNGVPRVSIVRVNADGSLDTTFNSGTGFSGEVSKIVVQPDSKILVVGGFTHYNGTIRVSIARLNIDGSLDNAFAPTIYVSFGVVDTMALQSDGKILIGGTFSIVNDQPRTAIARLNTDGSLDTSFNPVFGNPSVRSILVQADGKIMVGGSFNAVNGFVRANLVRLNADGTLDISFNAGNNFAHVKQVEAQASGKYVVLTLQSSVSSIIRLNNNGEIDATFIQSIVAPINQILVPPDDSILVAGSFTQFNNLSRSNFLRLALNGAIDRYFFPTGANGAVRTLARQTDGRILIGGNFSKIGGVMKLSIARLNAAPYRLITPFDFDGDSRADITVFRPTNGTWYILPSQTGNFYGFPFGQAGDQIAPADYDGDGKTDVAVFRDSNPGAGILAYFFILNSSDNSFRYAQFGATGDVPLPGDWDADGKADFAVYRPASTAGGQSFIYYRPSAQPTVDYVEIAFGTLGDKPLLGDFDGDGRLDPTVFRPSNATWYFRLTTTNQITGTVFGLSTDIPVPADYDGNGITEIAVFRPSTRYWYTSTNSQNNYGAVQFGATGDLPVPADYDGDGRTDVAVFRPSNGAWYMNRTTSGFTGMQFGANVDKPAPNAFIR